MAPTHKGKGPYQRSGASASRPKTTMEKVVAYEKLQDEDKWERSIIEILKESDKDVAIECFRVMANIMIKEIKDKDAKITQLQYNQQKKQVQTRAQTKKLKFQLKTKEMEVLNLTERVDELTEELGECQHEVAQQTRIMAGLQDSMVHWSQRFLSKQAECDELRARLRVVSSDLRSYRTWSAGYTGGPQYSSSEDQ